VILLIIGVPLEGEKQRWLMDYLYALSEHAPVVGVLGNHDWRGLVSFDKFARKKDVYIVDRFGQLELNLNGTKVCIVILLTLMQEKCSSLIKTNQ